MEKTKKKIARKVISPYSVQQAFIGLGLKETDDSTLRYLNYWGTQIPIAAAYFLHVLPKYNLLTALYEKETQMLLNDYSIGEDRRAQMKEELKSALSNWSEVLIEHDVKEGDPLEEMISFKDTLKADLLIIGQKKGSSSHGILAKNLTYSCTADALIIPQDAKPAISKILVPVDFSDSSAKALETAIAIQQQVKTPTQIICLHVYDLPDNNYFRNEAPWLDMKAKVESDLQSGFEAFLETAAGSHNKNITTALVERQSTGTAYFIMDFAHRNAIDFMVMGARGHSKVHLLLIGSVTEEVLDKNDHIPIFVTR
jgi:nucleotide-binding universal stress UspA family protein